MIQCQQVRQKVPLADIIQKISGMCKLLVLMWRLRTTSILSLDEWLVYVDNMLDSEERFEEEVKGILGVVFSIFDRDQDDMLDIDDYQSLLESIGVDPSYAAGYFRRLGLNDDR